MHDNRSLSHWRCAPAGLALLGLVVVMLDARTVLASEALGSCRRRDRAARGLDLRKLCPVTPPVDAGSSRRNAPVEKSP